MELHKALTHVDPTSNPPPVTSSTPVHPAPQQHHPPPFHHPHHHPHPHPHHHPAPMAFPLQPLTVKPAAAAPPPITYISGYGPMGIVDPVTQSGSAAGALTLDRKALTTKLRVAMTAGPLKTGERPKFAPY
ncbi:hypothetical protein ACOMHN_028907 [Nucella lapillus]